MQTFACITSRRVVPGFPPDSAHRARELKDRLCSPAPRECAYVMTIVTTRYGYKRPPRKRKAVARDVPTIVTPARRVAGPPMRSGASWCGGSGRDASPTCRVCRRDAVGGLRLWQAAGARARKRQSSQTTTLPDVPHVRSRDRRAHQGVPRPHNAAQAASCAKGMTARPVPLRHCSYGDAPLPTGREALHELSSAFPSWYLRITCDRCGKDLNRSGFAGGCVV